MGRKFFGPAVLLAAGLALIAGPAARAEQAEPRQVGGVGIAVFSDANFRGRNATFRTDTPDLTPYDLNDRISSLRVAPGEMWEVCEHRNYGGRCQVFSGAEPNLGKLEWSDAISSLRRVRGPGGGDEYYPPIEPPRRGLELFSRPRFQGDRRLIHEPVADLKRLGFNDDARSLRLDPSQSWEICADTNFRNCRVVNNDWSDLSGVGMAGRISSVRPWGQGGGGVRPPSPGSERIVLFDDPQYRGRSFNVDAAMPGLSNFGGRAESVQVYGGVWELCEGERFTGRCVSVTNNVADLAALGLRNRVRSIRPQ